MGKTQKIDDIRLVFIDSDETGLYRECSFDEFFAASFLYNPDTEENLMTKKKNFPSIHMLISMPKGFRFSFCEVIVQSILRYLRKVSTNHDKDAASGITYYQQPEYFPILCQKKKIYSFLSNRLVLNDIEVRFLNEYSWPYFIWVEAPIEYQHSRTKDFVIRIYNPFVEKASSHSFWPGTIQYIDGQPFRIQVADVMENLEQIEKFVLSLTKNSKTEWEY